MSPMYELEALRAVTGETVRPGSYYLTRRAIEFCRLKADSRLLDVGCGTGASVEFLIKEFALDAKGIDPTAGMLRAGIQRCPGLPVFHGTAEKLDFEEKSIDAVLSECSLCHYSDIRQALREFYRVLTADGWLIISDIYLRGHRQNEVFDSVSTFMQMETVLQCLKAQGFAVVLLEDHTAKLIQLNVDIIMKYGSMERFLEEAHRQHIECDFPAPRKGLKLGYYLIIAQKENGTASPATGPSMERQRR